MLIGTNPGQSEDIRGIPFCGFSGRHLNNILLNIGLDINKDIYVTNVIKCLTFENREPTFEEIANCENYLKQEIDIIKPVIIVTLGKIAGNWFRKKFTLYEDLKINKYQISYNWLPLYHPRYLGCNKEAKYQAYKTLKNILNELELV